MTVTYVPTNSCLRDGLNSAVYFVDDIYLQLVFNQRVCILVQIVFAIVIQMIDIDRSVTGGGLVHNLSRISCLVNTHILSSFPSSQPLPIRNMNNDCSPSPPHIANTTDATQAPVSSSTCFLPHLPPPPDFVTRRQKRRENKRGERER